MAIAVEEENLSLAGDHGDEIGLLGLWAAGADPFADAHEALSHAALAGHITGLAGFKQPTIVTERFKQAGAANIQPVLVHELCQIANGNIVRGGGHVIGKLDLMGVALDLCLQEAVLGLSFDAEGTFAIPLGKEFGDELGRGKELVQRLRGQVHTVIHHLHGHVVKQPVIELLSGGKVGLGDETENIPLGD